MLIYFEMINENFNINYKVFGEKKDNVLIFKDKSVSNTMMYVDFSNDMVEITRTGHVNMNQQFKLNQRLVGSYKDQTGIEANIASFTKEMVVNDNMIMLVYDYYLDNELLSCNKLKIIF